MEATFEEKAMWRGCRRVYLSGLGFAVILAALLALSGIMKNRYVALMLCLVLAFLLVALAINFLSKSAKTGVFLASAIALPFILQNALNLAVGVRLISSPALNQGALRALSALNGLLMFVVIAYALINRSIRVDSMVDNIMLIWIVVGVVGLVTGAMNGNDVAYLISDAYKWLIIPLGYYAYKSIIIKKNPDIYNIVMFIIIVGGVSTLLSGVFSLLFYLKRGHLAIFAANAVDIPFLVFLTTRVARKSDRPKRFLYYMLLMAVVVIGIITLKRGTWILMPVAVMAVWLTSSDIRISRVLAPLLTLLGVTAVVFILISGKLPSQLSSRWNYTFAFQGSRSGYDPSLGERFLEAQSALNEIQKRGSALDYVSGLGMGAEYYAPTSQVKELGSKPGYVHQTHATYIDVYFREGIIGLIAFLALVGSLTGVFIRIRKKRKTGETSESLLEASEIIFASFLVVLVAALSAVGFIGEIGWAILLAIFSAISSSSGAGPARLRTVDLTSKASGVRKESFKAE